MTKKISIQIASDFVCPWCLVGHVRLERALEDSGLKGQVEIKWLPFELNEAMPEDGLDRKTYFEEKFGGTEKMREIEANMKKIGEEDGIPFRQDLIKKSPNTFKAHRLAWFASKNFPERANDLSRKILEAYFTQGKDIGDINVLGDIAAEAGLGKNEVKAFLSSNEGIDDVRALEEQVRSRGVRMVPNFLINNDEEIRGAIPARDMQAILKAA